MDTKSLINEGGSSIVAEFLRRVQAAIFSRALMRTSNGRLGLTHPTTDEGDLICILYGCSGPVVLRRFFKTAQQVEDEEEEEGRVRARDLIKRVWEKVQLRKALRVRREERTKGTAVGNTEMEEAAMNEEEVDSQAEATTDEHTLPASDGNRYRKASASTLSPFLGIIKPSLDVRIFSIAMLAYVCIRFERYEVAVAIILAIGLSLATSFVANNASKLLPRCMPLLSRKPKPSTPDGQPGSETSNTGVPSAQEAAPGIV